MEGIEMQLTRATMHPDDWEGKGEIGFSQLHLR